MVRMGSPAPLLCGWHVPVVMHPETMGQAHNGTFGRYRIERQRIRILYLRNRFVRVFEPNFSSKVDTF